jgi:hypothetical protein
MTKHPLHPKLIDALSEYKTCPEAMRDAYDLGRDHQLKQVLKWLDEHLINYSDDDYCGRCASINDLEDHLKKAMRPTTQEDN